MNIFLGLIGVHEFFSFYFPLRGYVFFVPVIVSRKLMLVTLGTLKGQVHG